MLFGRILKCQRQIIEMETDTAGLPLREENSSGQRSLDARNHSKSSCLINKYKMHGVFATHRG
jgi:hypothetical protein